VGVQVMSVRRAAGGAIDPDEDLVLTSGDTLVLAGLEALAGRREAAAPMNPHPLPPRPVLPRPPRRRVLQAAAALLAAPALAVRAQAGEAPVLVLRPHPHRARLARSGVQFRDITPLLQDPKVFRVLIDAFVHRYMDARCAPTWWPGWTRAASSWARWWPTS
jgi:hypothetical protein